MDEVLESFAPGGADAELVHYRQVLAACNQVSVAASGLSFRGTITSYFLPTLGDDSSAYQMALTTEVGTVRVDLSYGLVVARRDNTVLVLVVNSLGPISIDQLQQQTAVAAMAKIA